MSTLKLKLFFVDIKFDFRVDLNKYTLWVQLDISQLLFLLEKKRAESFIIFNCQETNMQKVLGLER